MSTKGTKSKVPAPKAPAGGPPRGKKENYKGGLFDQIDLPAAASLLGCALLFLLALVGVRSVDYSSLNKPSLEDLPDRVAKILMPLKLPGKAAPKPKAPSARPGNAKATPSAGTDATAA